jgi:(1->4)-alpha-D-glucan 1-alpha-D-glucosylmutase
MTGDSSAYAPRRAPITRFAANAEPDDVFEAIDRDGAVIIEGLLTDDVMHRVNDDVSCSRRAADPNEAYETAVTDFVRKILPPSPENSFLNAFIPFQRKVAFFGQFNSLSQTLLKCTCPGVPDFYQGTELWDLSLVDPDNRRPVDFAQRRALLLELKRRWAAAKPADLLKELLSNTHTGQIKMFTTHRALQIRREHREVFEQGDYVPLNASGFGQKHLCAFLRRWKGNAVIVAAPRLVAGLTAGREIAPIAEAIWGDTFLLLPDMQEGQIFKNAFTKETVAVVERQGKRGFLVSQLFSQFPVALLNSV